jgi:hypothetical protein
MSGVPDLQVYRTFTALAEELDQLAQAGVSYAAGAAIKAAVHNLRGMAQALYEHSLEGEAEPDLQ